MIQARMAAVDGPAPDTSWFEDRLKVTNERTYRMKPCGGLWTSTYEPENNVSSWWRWCTGESFGAEKQRLWLLTPRADSRVFTIDSAQALHELHERFPADTPREGFRGSTGHYYEPWVDHGIDWLGIAEEFDAVRLTEDAHWETRLTVGLDTYSWDCESSVWFRWCFDAVEDAGIVVLPPSPYAWDDEDTSDDKATPSAQEGTE